MTTRRVVRRPPCAGSRKNASTRSYFDGEGFFHWITARALDELVDDGELESKSLPMHSPVTDAAIKGPLVLTPQMMRFFWTPGTRYVARRAEAIRKLVNEFSTTVFGRALGQQGELLFDAALPTQGFMPRARAIRAWAGREWTETDHNLDRVYERDGIAYGAEIKNTLIYMPPEEMVVKLRMCEHLGLRPLFIVRMAPKNYIELVRERGGYTFVFEWQQYPFGSGE